jgi:hypothetical protein
VHLVTYNKGRCETSFHPFVSSFICSVIHPCCHGLFILTGRRKSGIHTWHGKQSKGHHEASFHPSVHPFGHPFVLSWSVYSDRAEKKWNTDTTQRAKCPIKYTHTCTLHTALTNHWFYLWRKVVSFVVMRSIEPGCFRLCSWCLWKALDKEGCLGLVPQCLDSQCKSFWILNDLFTEN